MKIVKFGSIHFLDDGNIVLDSFHFAGDSNQSPFQQIVAKLRTAFPNEVQYKPIERATRKEALMQIRQGAKPYSNESMAIATELLEWRDRADKGLL